MARTGKTMNTNKLSKAMLRMSVIMFAAPDAVTVGVMSAPTLLSSANDSNVRALQGSGKGSGKGGSGSNNAQSGSGKGDSSSNNAQSGSGKGDSSSNNAQSGSGKGDSNSNNAQSGSGKGNSDSSAAQSGNGKGDSNSNNAQSGSGKGDSNSNNVQSGSGKGDSSSNNAQSGSGKGDSSSNNAQSGSGKGNSGSNDAQSGSGKGDSNSNAQSGSGKGNSDSSAAQSGSGKGTSGSSTYSGSDYQSEFKGSGKGPQNESAEDWGMGDSMGQPQQPQTGSGMTGDQQGGESKGTGKGGNAGGGMSGGRASCTSRPCAASNLGDIAFTTASGTDARSGVTFSAGENIYGPFEAGFSSQQNFILEGLGCANGNDGHVIGGIDTATAEAMVAHQCSITLPRIEGGQYISLLDECGGHTREYHFHEKLTCLYDVNAAGHSAQVGQEADPGDGVQYYIYGKFETTGTLPSDLDACNGHFGVTPDSNGESVYHYHVTDAAPFTLGCHGPDNSDSANPNKPVTLEKCFEVDTDCSSSPVSIMKHNKSSGAGETLDYVLYCSCYDKTTGSNAGTQPSVAASQAQTESQNPATVSMSMSTKQGAQSTQMQGGQMQSVQGQDNINTVTMEMDSMQMQTGSVSGANVDASGAAETFGISSVVMLFCAAFGAILL